MVLLQADFHEFGQINDNAAIRTIDILQDDVFDDSELIFRQEGIIQGSRFLDISIKICLFDEFKGMGFSNFDEGFDQRKNACPLV